MFLSDLTVFDALGENNSIQKLQMPFPPFGKFFSGDPESKEPSKFVQTKIAHAIIAHANTALQEVKFHDYVRVAELDRLLTLNRENSQNRTRTLVQGLLHIIGVLSAIPPAQLPVSRLN